jgi:hypothetical protein
VGRMYSKVCLIDAAPSVIAYKSEEYGDGRDMLLSCNNVSRCQKANAGRRLSELLLHHA